METPHQVADVERAEDSRWVVHVEQLDTFGNVLENKILTSNALAMAAGSLSTPPSYIQNNHIALDNLVATDVGTVI
ncbi:hypothetical protein [Nocardia sp. 2TAF39]|uniref:hypothetical protein n=1 Tax=unclassified Nocardia TaxID=2637762 RepID=UPI003F9D98CC